MNDFIAFVKQTPQYTNLVFIHGERLFIRRNGVFEVPAIELAWKAYQFGLSIEGEYHGKT
ncbi:hypothetical protein HYG93_07600 [Acinetobacter sp. SwsAc6]|uniref:hypothetical protein n=1 Tax=Acinetobacter sp. SwsAc6 TaxID=2749439 RepID=UPI0015C15E79|nr:hypothetical protein [Acinetobacter sp. SwsAc6]NWK74154.1 hypothetical protein [Acinetobacter sp. SwsAc6]